MRGASLSRASTPATLPVMTEPEREEPFVEEAFERLAQDLKRSFGEWGKGHGAWSEDRFAELAIRAFGVQYRGNRAYRLYCRARGIVPDLVDDWRSIPPVPTAAFGSVDLVVGNVPAKILTFRTSGTSRGRTRRGRHRVPDPGLYRAALRPAFRRYVLSGLTYPPSIITLLPSFTFSPDSSLGWMLDDVREAFGGPGSVSTALPEGVDWEKLHGSVERARVQGRPVCLLGTTLSLASWLSRLEDSETRHELPAGSRIMDTGGAKGSPATDRSDVMARLGVRLGIPPDRIVNEFGMTELLSQRYDRVAGQAGSSGALEGPPWLRTRVLDPVTLEELPEGEVGVLSHFDLANAGSVCHVLTEDLGSVAGGLLRWHGRVAGSPPRGCSLATAELLAAQTDA